MSEDIIKTFQVYGSYETELDLPWSDIDLVIEGKGGYDSHNVDYTLSMIEQSLKSRIIIDNNWSEYHWIKSISYFDRAAIPIIKMTCQYKSIEVIVDITHANEAHKGIECI